MSRIGIDNSADGEKFTAAVEKLESRGIRRSPSPASVDPDQVYKDFLDQMEVEKQKQAANVGLMIDMTWEWRHVCKFFLWFVLGAV